MPSYFSKITDHLECEKYGSKYLGRRWWSNLSESKNGRDIQRKVSLPLPNPDWKSKECCLQEPDGRKRTKLFCNICKKKNLDYTQTFVEKFLKRVQMNLCKKYIWLFKLLRLAFLFQFIYFSKDFTLFIAILINC